MGKINYPKQIPFEDTTFSDSSPSKWAHFKLKHRHNNRIILEFFGPEIPEMVALGFLDPVHWHRSMYEYAKHIDLVI